jgi:hypothetical protein
VLLAGSTAHPIIARSKARRRAAARRTPEAPPVDAPADRHADTVEDLLTAWISGARGVHEPDTLDDCADYARYLDEVSRARRQADAMCRCLRARVAKWIEDESNSPHFIRH